MTSNAAVGGIVNDAAFEVFVAEGERYTAWREMEYEGRPLRVRAQYGFAQHGTQEPYFAVTGESQVKALGGWRADSCGCLHELIGAAFPELRVAIRWHLCTAESGPMHYASNALDASRAYLSVLVKAETPDLAKATQALDRFASTVVYGAVYGERAEDRAVAAVMVTDDWCKQRLPALLAAFRRDVLAIDVAALDAGATSDDDVSALEALCARDGITAKVECTSRSAVAGTITYDAVVRRGRLSIKTRFSAGSCWNDGQPPEAHHLICSLIRDAGCYRDAPTLDEFARAFGDETPSQALSAFKACKVTDAKLERFLADERAEYESVAE